MNDMVTYFHLKNAPVALFNHYQSLVFYLALKSLLSYCLNGIFAFLYSNGNARLAVLLVGKIITAVRIY